MSEIDEDDVRFDEPWNDKLENYVFKLRRTATIASKKHDAAGYHFKKRGMWFGLPTTIVPLVMAPVSLILGNTHPWALPISAAALLVSGLSSGIYDFFSYGEQVRDNFNCSAQWTILANEIDCEMIKDRKYRQQADVFTSRIQMKYDALLCISPVIPKKIIDDIEKKEMMSAAIVNPV